MSVSTEEEAQLVESLLRKEGWLMPGIPALRSQEVEPEGQKEIQSWTGETTWWLESFL